MQIERKLAIPLYEQLANALRRRIETGDLAAGARLPPESELVSAFAISRVTARKALDLLVAKGLIVRRQGIGTFVAPPKIQQDLHTLRGFAEVVAELGSAQVMEVLEFGLVPADATVAGMLAAGADERVLRITRRHLLDDVPIALAIIYIPAAFGGSFTLEEVSTTPIYELLARKSNVRIKRATQVVRATAAEGDTAKLLSLTRSSPVMMVERVTYSTEEKPVEYIIFFYRGDRYELSIELFRDSQQNVLPPMDVVARLRPDGGSSS